MTASRICKRARISGLLFELLYWITFDEEMEILQMFSSMLGAIGIFFGFMPLVVGLCAIFKDVEVEHKGGYIHGNLTTFGRFTLIIGIVLGFCQIVLLMKYSRTFTMNWK